MHLMQHLIMHDIGRIGRFELDSLAAAPAARQQLACISTASHPLEYSLLRYAHTHGAHHLLV